MVLVSVWTTVNLQRNVTRDWQGTIDIKIVPIVADQNIKTQEFVGGLRERDFNAVSEYLVAQAKRYQRDLTHSLNITLDDPVEAVPPLTPSSSEGRLAIMLWSLKLRWWAWRHRPDDYHSLQTRLYVLYQTPKHNQALPHSTGLQNGLIGLIHARAKPQLRRHNNVVLVHELLHILGAADKYDLNNGRPIYPHGYAQPRQRYPQRYAEVMARAIPISDTDYEVAQRLSQTLVGKKTAAEIGWIVPEQAVIQR